MRPNVRENYYVFLALSVIWLVGLSMIGPLFLGVYFFPCWVVSALLFAFLGFRFECPYCGNALVRPKITIGTVETTGYSAFPGKTCTNCRQDVTGKSP